ncbi:unnamed protein product [Closterium sp. Naga37s-1]|nr:unnamed protein product [Closterium sp. Naga37s-1]
MLENFSSFLPRPLLPFPSFLLLTPSSRSLPSSSLPFAPLPFLPPPHPFLPFSSFLLLTLCSPSLPSSSSPLPPVLFLPPPPHPFVLHPCISPGPYPHPVFRALVLIQCSGFISALMLIQCSGFIFVRSQPDIFRSFGFKEEPVIIAILLFQNLPTPVPHLLGCQLSSLTSTIATFLLPSLSL